LIIIIGESAPIRDVKEATERKVIEDVLRLVQANKTKAAEILGIHRTSLYDKLKGTGKK